MCSQSLDQFVECASGMADGVEGSQNRIEIVDCRFNSLPATATQQSEINNLQSLLPTQPGSAAPQSPLRPAPETRFANPAAPGLLPLARRLADRTSAAGPIVRRQLHHRKSPPADEWAAPRKEPRRRQSPIRHRCSLCVTATTVPYRPPSPPVCQFRLSTNASCAALESRHAPASRRRAVWPRAPRRSVCPREVRETANCIASW